LEKVANEEIAEKFQLVKRTITDKINKFVQNSSAEPNCTKFMNQQDESQNGTVDPKFLLPFPILEKSVKNCVGLKLLTKCNSTSLCQLAQTGENELKHG